jgi:hypothetical protein
MIAIMITGWRAALKITGWRGALKITGWRGALKVTERHGPQPAAGPGVASAAGDVWTG